MLIFAVIQVNVVYTFTVTATDNTAGTSAPSIASNKVIARQRIDWRGNSGRFDDATQVRRSLLRCC